MEHCVIKSHETDSTGGYKHTHTHGTHTHTHTHTHTLLHGWPATAEEPGTGSMEQSAAVPACGDGREARCKSQKLAAIQGRVFLLARTVSFLILGRNAYPSTCRQRPRDHFSPLPRCLPPMPTFSRLSVTLCLVPPFPPRILSSRTFPCFLFQSVSASSERDIHPFLLHRPSNKYYFFRFLQFLLENN